jgi:hypothetical protein
MRQQALVLWVVDEEALDGAANLERKNNSLATELHAIAFAHGFLP